MLKLSAKIREEKADVLRRRGAIPAVLYGPTVKSFPIEVDTKEFEKIFEEAGESSLVSLEVKGAKPSEYLVLIYRTEKDSLTLSTSHIDFYQPNLEEEVEVTIPIAFVGEAPAVRELGGTLVKNISEVEIKAKPQDLIREIEIDVSKLNTFEDHIFIKDIVLPKGVSIDKDPEEIIALVSEPKNIEEELAAPIEEKVEEVKMAEAKVKEEPEAEDEK